MVVNCNILALVKVGQGDLQPVGILAERGQSVKLVKADPALSLKK